MLAEHGANLDTQDADGFTPAFLAAGFGDAEVVEQSVQPERPEQPEQPEQPVPSCLNPWAI